MGELTWRYLSASDAEIAGDFTDEHVEQALAIIVDQWSVIEGTARGHMAEFNERYPEFLTS